MKTVGILLGSLRKDSFSRKMAKAMIALSPAELTFEIIEINELQMYNQDCDEAPPQAWTSFRSKIQGLASFLFITPEYNRSIPAVLKNALDVASRPYGKNMWSGKSGAVISFSPGNLGGFGANHHLRQVLVCLNIIAMPQPEAYISSVGAMFDDQGQLINESTQIFLKKFIEAFMLFIDRQ